MSRSQQLLIFGGAMQFWDVEQIEEEVDQLDKKRDFLETGVRRPSAYVDVFETMVRTVLECEHHLLSDKEVEILERFSKLCYNARYCLIRLVLRKVNQWLPLSSLEKYTKEVGENGLEAAVYDLCLPFGDLYEQQPVVKMEPTAAYLEPGISIRSEYSTGNFNILEDLDVDDMKPDISDSSIMTTPLRKEVFDRVWPQRAGPSQLPQPEDPIKAVLHSDRSNIRIDFFCENEIVMTTQEILGRLSKELLVGLAKEMKCKVRPNSKKDDIISSLQQQAAGQQILDFGTPITKKGRGNFPDPYQQTQLSHYFVKEPKQKTNQEQRLRELATKRLGPCIRVNFNFYCLVRKLHIICYRATEHPMDLLKPALLSKFKKRNYTPYKHNRTAEAWVSREDLLEYERALELDDLLDAIMKEQAPTASKRAAKTPFPQGRSLATPVTPSSTRDFASPLKTPEGISFRQSAPPVLDVSEFAEQQEHVKLRKEIVIKKHFEDWIYPTWQNYVASETVQGVRPRPIGLERFDPGHVFTRMVHKASQVLGPLKEYRLEVETLDALLEQRFWCRGKRAKWYTRRAVVLQHLAAAEKHLEKKRDIQWRSLEGIKAALLDDDTGIVYCPNLVKRLMALEKILRIPLNERSQCDGKLRDAPVVELTAIRVEPLKFDVHGRLTNEKGNMPDLHKFLSLAPDNGRETEEPAKKTGKSSWKGRDDQIVNVETRALEYYEDQGYRGFHCETRILTTIFGLLFWDIIFADSPGAFDTPYQTAPLDLLHDSFYRARKKIIDKRLQEIRDGMGYEILQKHDESHRDRSVICVGVSWDLCPREDLLDIVNCLGGNTLAIICQLFCEDYRGRSSGVPDLFIWKAKEQKCKFVEVKGPGDIPQENQRFWFDSLLRANADVEICKVIDSAKSSNDSKNKKKRKRKTRSSPRETSASRPLDDSEHEDPDLDYEGERNDVSQMPQGSIKRRRISGSGKHSFTETEI